MLKHKTILILSVLVFLGLFFLNAGWWVFLLVFIVVSALIVWGSFDIRSNYFLKVICSNTNVTENKIALTFDDGPHEVTQEILNILKKYDAKATFFCIGKNIENRPELLEQMHQEGHTIGNHTYSHSNSFGFMSVKELNKELTATDQIVQQVLGKKMKLFRPPFGVTNPNLAKVISSTKHKVIGWNIRSLDTVINDEETIFNRVIKKIHPGGIVLFHDTSMKTASVLERLLQEMERKKIKSVTVDSLLKISPYEE